MFHMSCTRMMLAMLIAIFGAGARAEGITIEEWRGHNIMRLSGEISTGFADQLASKIDQTDVWADGTRVLLLDSPGGRVDEAMRVSEVMRKFPVHTVVPNGASCASACASIVFVAGKYRTIEAFGKIGQHSCSRGGLPDESCNEKITDHAVENGLSPGSIAAFLTYTPPSDMIWFSREDIDGWGLSRYPGEEASGFENREPRVFRMFTGVMPPAQSAWRLDFHGDGYRAFVRTVSDAEREMQLNLFCHESLPGRLFLSMEVNGDVGKLKSAVTKVSVGTEDFSWSTDQPLTLQKDPAVASVVMEIPGELIERFLTSADRLVFEVDLREPFVPMRATTYLTQSRTNLLFAANHCTQEDYDLSGQPISQLQ